MKIFEKNQNNAERILRFLMALFMIPAPLIIGTSFYSLILFTIGAILIFNAIIGTCMIYKIMGINTCNK
tara:strand:- start:452 stop:658 length:207 start_codon:yes stop_codon:yes gene_type:complete